MFVAGLSFNFLKKYPNSSGQDVTHLETSTFTSRYQYFHIWGPVLSYQGTCTFSRKYCISLSNKALLLMYTFYNDNCYLQSP